MNLSLIRDIFTENSTTGKLFIENDFECFVLEDEDRKLEAGGKKVYGKTAIPRGRYKIELDWSPKYGRDMPHVLDVPHFDGIRIHTGNYAGEETFFKIISIDTLKDVLYSEEYLEVT